MTFGLFESFERLFRFDVVNNSGEIIPPFACMELDYEFESGKSALSVDGSTLLVSVKKPTADNLSSPERFLINGPMSIAIDGFGSAYKLPIMQALMDVATPPSPGDAVGPTEDSWLLSSSGTGWVVKSLDAGEAYVDGDTASVFVEMIGSGGALRYCVLAEDATSCPVWAFRGSMGNDGEISVSEPSDLFQLYFHSQLLSSPKVARAGYGCQYGLDDEGRDSFIGNPCIDGCQGTGTVDGSDLPNGNVAEEYTGTVSTDNLNSSGVSATGLPPGLSIDAETGEITGTPTEAGTYLVTFMAVDDSGCALTDIAEIVIGEALPDEGGGPDPEPPIP